MENDVSNLTYLPDQIDEELLDRIVSAMRYSWSTIDATYKILDCKIQQAKWVSNKSALEAFDWIGDVIDETQFNVIEATYSIWIASKKARVWNPERIDRFTYTEYLFASDLLESGPETCNIHLLYHGSLQEETIENTGLSDEGIAELVNILEEDLIDIELDEFVTYEFSDSLHPKIKKFNRKAYKILLKKKEEFDLYVINKNQEKNRQDIALDPQPNCMNIEASFLSKYSFYYIDLQLAYYHEDNICNSLTIIARPHRTGAMIRFEPIWTKTVAIEPVMLKNATKYLRTWPSKKEHIDLLKSFHLVSAQFPSQGLLS